jgi:Ca-activated chloride channel homolog
MKVVIKSRILLSAFAVLVAAIVFTLQPAMNAQQEKKQGQNKPQEQKPPKKVDEEQTIKLDTQLVNVLFSAQNKQNRYINDIKQEEIEVLENGQPQQIFTFRREFDLPLTLALLIDVSGSEQYTLPLLKDAGGNL